jgi:hypothetical protein
MRLGEQLRLDACPHCGRANPVIRHLWTSDARLIRGDGQPGSRWAVYACTSCANALLGKGAQSSSNPRQPDPVNAEIIDIIPAPRVAPVELPETARNFLQQAYNTLHAPDAAGVMAASAVDAMLKAIGYTDGSLYTRIDKAVEDHILTSGMGDWAHHVRLGANNVRHADAARPHLTQDEARQCVEFADAMGQFLFVLAAKVSSGLAQAQKAQ